MNHLLAKSGHKRCMGPILILILHSLLGFGKSFLKNISLARVDTVCLVLAKVFKKLFLGKGGHKLGFGKSF